VTPKRVEVIATLLRQWVAEYTPGEGVPDLAPYLAGKMLRQFRMDNYDPWPDDPTELIVPHLPKAPAWVVFGGLGNPGLVESVLKRWPSVKLLGTDRRAEVAAEYTSRFGSDPKSPWLNVALGEADGVAEMWAAAEGEKPGAFVEVATLSLDSLEKNYGPFTDCLLWLSCEGYEYAALSEAVNLLESDRLLGVNLEARYHLAPTNAEMYALLEAYGYRRTLVWYRRCWGHNELWVKNV